MNLRENFLLALGALAANKTRASLTLLAIVVGVFAVISASTAVGVIDNYFRNTMQLMGSNVINITTNPSIVVGDGSHMRGREPIRINDFETLQQRAVLGYAMSPDVVFRTTRIQYDDRETNPNIPIRGGNEFWMENNAYDIAEGRGLNEADITSARQVAVIGDDVRNRLFTGVDPLGKRILIDGQFYTVVGVFESRGAAFGQSMDNFVLIPYTRLAMVYGRNRNVQIQVKAPSIAMVNETIDELTGILRVMRNVAPSAPNDFEIETNESLHGMFSQFTNVLYIFGFVVGGIALFGAGIGVMNIMLVSVTERTREIGIRKAIGANKRTIIHQFLMEAIIICQLGGLIGMIIGIAGGNALVFVMNADVVIPVGAIISGIVGMLIIGVTFGVYPAWKAAQLDPIESLRYE